MAKLTTYSSKGVKKTAVEMPKDMKEKVNMALLAQAVRVYENKLHPGLSKVKSRGEVNLSKRKIYRQKGTGGARHGAKSAPIFVGGGVTHGPKGVKRKLSMPAVMRKKALNVALNIKAKEGELFVVDGLSTIKKTKEVNDMLTKIIDKEKTLKKNIRFTIALSRKNKDTSLYIRNLYNAKVENFKDLNAYKVFFGGVLLLDKDAFNEKNNEKSYVSKSKKRRETRKTSMNSKRKGKQSTKDAKK
jgi:large subunit ribosomal protein L4